MTLATATRTARKATEIQSAALYRCTDKATREVFYLVASDSQPGVYYAVRFDHARLAWTCQCPANKPCKHERAVQEVLKIRRARIAAQIGGDMPAIIAELETREMPTAHADDELSEQPYACPPDEDIDADPFKALFAQERARKMAANQAYRDMFPDDYGYVA